MRKTRIKNYLEFFAARLIELGLSDIQASATFESIREDNPEEYASLKTPYGMMEEDDILWLWEHVYLSAANWIAETEGEEKWHAFLVRVETHPVYSKGFFNEGVV